jgi:hypothetical protein
MANTLQGAEGIGVPTIIKSLSWTAAGAQTIWTPASGRKFRLLRYIIGLTADASFTVAAGPPIIFADSGTPVISQAVRFFVPAAAGALVGMFTTGWVDLDNGYLSLAANNILTINSGIAALLTGSYWAVVCGTEE